uniref:Anaphase-promoting complex subunit 4 WD40 domain-containing protein n=1 Tax=Arcella intermedia TaxID=1963864 RepID=A0A6B2LH20_9EUKA
MVATARFMDKTVTVYQEDRTLCEFRTPGHPYQVAFTPGLNLLAALMSNSVMLYDVRQGAVKGATVMIPLLAETSAFALSAREEVIAVGGESRNVSVFETRTWKLKSNWKNPVKYEITSLHLSTNKDYCYVADDSVLLCGKWKSSNKSNTRQYFSNSMRMESRHTGISHVTADDSIIVLTESAKIHILKNGSHEAAQPEEEPERKKQRTHSEDED